MSSFVNDVPAGTPGRVRWMRAAAVVVYLGVIGLCFTTAWGPRVLWSVLVPLLPLWIIVVGFHTWRLTCPLAALGSVGPRLSARADAARRALGGPAAPATRTPRRAPAWLERWSFVVSLGGLMAMLVLRLVALNGDGPWLGVALIGLAVLAAGVNVVFSGKTWCNFVCPVGVVERIFTDPKLRETATSRCGACTACKKNCPDIDQENAYWKDVRHPARRAAFYAYPGVVLAFYAYYWLREGRWQGFLDGTWLRTGASARLLWGPGFFFLPRVPAFAAAAVTMAALAVASYTLFDVVEDLATRWVPDTEHRRHVVLTLAAFAAFNLYYVFAGPPALRGIPGAAPALAFAVPVISTWAAARRWRQTSEGFVQARSARRLVPLWPLDVPPPRDPAALLAFFKGQEIAREAQLAAYREALQKVVLEWPVRSRDVRLLEHLRSDLGIGEADHRRAVAALPDAQRRLFEVKEAAYAEKQRARAAAAVGSAPADRAAGGATVVSATTTAGAAAVARPDGDRHPGRDDGSMRQLVSPLGRAGR